MGSLLFNRRVLVFLASFILIGNTVSATQYKVFSGGETTYSIIVSKEASESEQYAAKELQAYIKKISGVSIPIKQSGGGRVGNRIIVGYNNDIRSIMPNIQCPNADDEAFFYRNVKGDIVILGGRERGTMYGVFSFLENEFGCRWYTQSVTLIPYRDQYSFEALDFSDSPKIPVRNILYSEVSDAEFRVHCRINEKIKTSPNKPEKQQGGCYGLLAPHTFWFLLPSEEYYPNHPEYFALRNGKRLKGNTQPCFTNPDVLRTITNNLRKIMRDRPEFDVYEASTLDNHNHCECDNCRAAIVKMGSYTDLLLDFVNKISVAVEKEFPDKKIEFLAYQDTKYPPINVRPNHNVAVRIANIEGCHSHGFKECSSSISRTYWEYLSNWREVSKELNVWEYASNFSVYNIPYPNFYALQKNLITYQQLGVKGILEEGNHYTSDGELQALRIYVLSKLLWNPYCDIDVLVNDFIQGYYGSSAPFIRQYFDLIHEKATTATHLTPFTAYEDSYYGGDFITEALLLFKKAKSVADSEEILRRVELEEFSVCLLNSLRNPKKAVSDGTYSQVKRIIERESIDLRREEIKNKISQLQSYSVEETRTSQRLWKEIISWFKTIFD